MDRIRIFLEVKEIDDNFAITEVEERNEPSYTYVDDKLHITVYSDLHMDFPAGIYIGMYLAMDKGQP